jgi:hypothetical protein
LCRYQEEFSRFGIRGVDLLTITDKQFSELGITSTVHAARMETCLQQLIVYQHALDVDVAEDKANREAEENYIELEKKLEARLLKNPSYQLPTKMSAWDPVDVIMAMKKSGSLEKTRKFLKPVGIKFLNGKEFAGLTVEKIKVCVLMRT